MSAEEWRQVPGYCSIEVSSFGRIRRPGRRARLGSLSWGGYLVACVIADDGQVRRAGVHVFVALAFHGPCPGAKVTDHIDGAGWNNRPENLRYVTASENATHRGPMSGGGPMSRMERARKILELPPARIHHCRGCGRVGHNRASCDVQLPAPAPRSTP